VKIRKWRGRHEKRNLRQHNENKASGINNQRERKISMASVMAIRRKYRAWWRDVIGRKTAYSKVIVIDSVEVAP